MTRRQIKINKSLYVDQEFFQFLLNSNSIICQLILNTETNDEINYISSTDHQDKVSYLPQSKFNEEITDPFANKIGRVTLKVGRFINKLLTEKIIESLKISKSEIEKFVNDYKSWFDPSKFVLRVVEGEEIRKWYNETNYFTINGSQQGSLWNSCMRYQKRMRFLDLYCKNPKVKMLVMLQQVDDKWYVRSRALLWEEVEVIKDFSDNFSGKIKVMDRIYSFFDSDVPTFKKWAHENGYLPKYEQNSKSHQFFDVKGDIVRIRFQVELDKSRFDHYPYLDTFPYFNYGNGKISNDESNFNWDYKLVQATGGLEPERQEEDNQNDEDW